jgi:O-antigen ligase
VRAIAIALFAVFLALGVMASQRGRGSGLLGVTVLFLALVVVGGYESRLAWLAALIVAAAGALSMTRRLIDGPRQSRA